MRAILVAGALPYQSTILLIVLWGLPSITSASMAASHPDGSYHEPAVVREVRVGGGELSVAYRRNCRTPVRVWWLGC